jgi:hypothetical protein
MAHSNVTLSTWNPTLTDLESTRSQRNKWRRLTDSERARSLMYTFYNSLSIPFLRSCRSVIDWNVTGWLQIINSEDVKGLLWYIWRYYSMLSYRDRIISQTLIQITKIWSCKAAILIIYLHISTCSNFFKEPISMTDHTARGGVW